jgi:hypothetical protein
MCNVARSNFFTKGKYEGKVLTQIPFALKFPYINSFGFELATVYTSKLFDPYLTSRIHGQDNTKTNL